MTSVFLFCISERKLMPLVRNGKLGRFKLHEAHALEPKLNSLIFCQQLCWVFLICPPDLLSTHHSILYPRRLISTNCINQALLTSGFRLVSRPQQEVRKPPESSQDNSPSMLGSNLTLVALTILVHNSQTFRLLQVPVDQNGNGFLPLFSPRAFSLSFRFPVTFPTNCK